MGPLVTLCDPELHIPQVILLGKKLGRLPFLKSVFLAGVEDSEGTT